MRDTPLRRKCARIASFQPPSTVLEGLLGLAELLIGADAALRWRSGGKLTFL